MRVKAIVPTLVIVMIAAVVAGRTVDGGDAGGDGAGSAAGGSAERPRWFGGSRCTVLADPPSRDRSTNRISGAAHYRCDRPGGDVELTVYLQRRDDNRTWATVDSRLVAASGKDTTRQRSDRERTVSASGVCVEGVYRTFVRGTVTIESRGSPVEHASKAVTNPCVSGAH
jgi:hypothetical protein